MKNIHNEINIEEIKRDYCSLIKNKTEYLEPFATTIYLSDLFDIDTIVPIITRLVSIIEGVEYTCADGKYDIFNSYRYPWDEVLIVWKNERKSFHYSEQDSDSVHKDYLEYVCDKYDGFVLARKNFTFIGNSISIYHENWGWTECIVDFRRFTYVKEFFDIVIGYSLMKNKDSKQSFVYKSEKDFVHTTPEELELIFEAFIRSKVKLIESNYRKRDLERIRDYKNKLIEEKKKRDEEISKIMSSIRVRNYKETG